MMESGGRATLHVASNEQGRQAFMALKAWPSVRQQVAVQMDLSDGSDPYLIMNYKGAEDTKAQGVVAITDLMPILCREFAMMSAAFRVSGKFPSHVTS